MEHITAIVLGLLLRYIVDFVGRHDFKVVGTIVGLWEGVTLLHFIRRNPWTVDPYLAYIVRLLLDLYFTESIARLVLTVAWSCLGMVLADITKPIYKRLGLVVFWERFVRDMSYVPELIPKFSLSFDLPSIEFPKLELPKFEWPLEGSRNVRFSSARSARAPSHVTEVQNMSMSSHPATIQPTNHSTRPPRISRRRSSGGQTGRMGSANTITGGTDALPRRLVPGSLPGYTSSISTLTQAQYPPRRHRGPLVSGSESDRGASIFPLPFNRNDYGGSTTSLFSYDLDNENVSTSSSARSEAADSVANAVEIPDEEQEVEIKADRTPKQERIDLPPLPLSHRRSVYEVTLSGEPFPNGIYEEVPPTLAEIRTIPDQRDPAEIKDSDSALEYFDARAASSGLTAVPPVPMKDRQTSSKSTASEAAQAGPSSKLKSLASVKAIRRASRERGDVAASKHQRSASSSSASQHLPSEGSQHTILSQYRIPTLEYPSPPPPPSLPALTPAQQFAQQYAAASAGSSSSPPSSVPAPPPVSPSALPPAPTTPKAKRQSTSNNTTPANTIGRSSATLRTLKPRPKPAAAAAAASPPQPQPETESKPSTPKPSKPEKTPEPPKPEELEPAPIPVPIPVPAPAPVPVPVVAPVPAPSSRMNILNLFRSSASVVSNASTMAPVAPKPEPEPEPEPKPEPELPKIQTPPPFLKVETPRRLPPVQPPTMEKESPVGTPAAISAAPATLVAAVAAVKRGDERSGSASASPVPVPDKTPIIVAKKNNGSPKAERDKTDEATKVKKEKKEKENVAVPAEAASAPPLPSKIPIAAPVAPVAPAAAPPLPPPPSKIPVASKQTPATLQKRVPQPTPQPPQTPQTPQTPQPAPQQRRPQTQAAPQNQVAPEPPAPLPPQKPTPSTPQPIQKEPPAKSQFQFPGPLQNLFQSQPKPQPQPQLQPQLQLQQPPIPDPSQASEHQQAQTGPPYVSATSGGEEDHDLFSDVPSTGADSLATQPEQPRLARLLEIRRRLRQMDKELIELNAQRSKIQAEGQGDKAKKMADAKSREIERTLGKKERLMRKVDKMFSGIDSLEDPPERVELSKSGVGPAVITAVEQALEQHLIPGTQPTSLEVVLAPSKVGQRQKQKVIDLLNSYGLEYKTDAKNPKIIIIKIPEP